MYGFDDPQVLATGALAAALAALFLTLHLRLQRAKSVQTAHNIRQLALLRALISGFQRHRGLSNGLMCGDTGLRDELIATRDALDSHIRRAGKIGTSHRDSWLAISDHWSRLRELRARSQADNLAQHDLIIRGTIFLMEDVAGDLDLVRGRRELRYLPCIWREVIQAAEWAGQARALGTGMAAAGQCHAGQRIRLRFLYHKIQELSDSPFEVLQRHVADCPGMFDLKRCEQAVTDFLLCIDEELLRCEQPTIAAKIYFQQATHAIDELLKLVDAALHHLQSVYKTTL